MVKYQLTYILQNLWSKLNNCEFVYKKLQMDSGLDHGYPVCIIWVTIIFT